MISEGALMEPIRYLLRKNNFSETDLSTFNFRDHLQKLYQCVFGNLMIVFKTNSIANSVKIHATNVLIYVANH